MTLRVWLLLCIGIGLNPVTAVSETPPPVVVVTIGAKQFPESLILAEMAVHLTRSVGVPDVRRKTLQGTRLAWEALKLGELDAYPDYTGTLRKEIFAKLSLPDDRSLQSALEDHDIRMTGPIGFNNTYALGMKPEKAEELSIRTTSDLVRYPELKFGFSNEFMDREDGWPSLRTKYGLPQQNVTGLEHQLAYRGLDTGAIDVLDLYSTDPEIKFYNLRVLEDDLKHFPAYDAVFLYRADLEDRAPHVVAALRRLEGQIDDVEMSRLNARSKIDKVSATRVAADFLNERFSLDAESREEGPASRIAKRTLEHIFLVAVSLGAAILVSIPLGILSVKQPACGQVILAVTGLLITIPGLALLVLLIRVMGMIGTMPAIVALFLYSLLPIVRNTYTGLRDIPIQIRESAIALGLPTGARLWLVEMPMASGTILAGIKIAAVLNVGFATLGALIGAGGYGQPILTGVSRADSALVLEGAIPSALLALVVLGIFEAAERFVVPKGLRLKRG